MIVFQGYEDRYHDGVLACLIRNYEDMQTVRPEVIAQWLEPMLRCRWQSDQPAELPLQHGIVMLADGSVVGFTSCVYSRMKCDGRKYAVCKTATVAIDKEYRRYPAEDGTSQRAIQRMYQEILASADVVTGDTAVPVMRRFLRDVMHFVDYDTRNYKFYPIPCFRRELQCTSVREPEDIDDEEVRAAFRDHMPYDLRCVKAAGRDGTCYVLYRMLRKKFRREPFHTFGLRFASVLEVVGRDMFGRHAHEIIWAIQKKERAFLEADSRFFGDAGPRYPAGYRTYETFRMAYAADGRFDPGAIGNLYSELVIMNSYR